MFDLDLEHLDGYNDLLLDAVREAVTTFYQRCVNDPELLKVDPQAILVAVDAVMEGFSQLMIDTQYEILAPAVLDAKES